MGREEAWSERFAARWESYDAGGWEYLLPQAAGGRWLSVDCTGGATSVLLASALPHLTVVPGLPEMRAGIAAKIDLLGLTNVRLATTNVIPRATPAGRPYDGFVLHDLKGALDRAAVARALSGGRAAVAGSGSLYVALRNRYGYGRFKHGLHGVGFRSARRFRPTQVMRALGSTSAAVYPYISSSEGWLVDVIPPSGYVSAQNPFAFSERLRRALLGPLGASLIAPAFAVLASGSDAGPSALDDAVAELERRRGMAPGSFVTTRYHCLRGGKVVVFVGAPDDPGERFVIVFARAPLAIERRRREFAMLERLRELPPDLARHVPRPEYQGDCLGGRLFVMNAFPGVTLEANVRGLGAATLEGAEFITRMHIATQTRVEVNDTRFELLCGSAFADATTRYPILGAQLADLRSAVRNAMVGAKIPLVWMHGDFKVENLVVDARSSRLSGVIDWELTEPEGLPLLDLWYLLLYNRKIRSGTPFFPAVLDLITPSKLSPEETALCLDYVTRLRLPGAIVPALAAMLVVHHCGRRMIYDQQDGAMMGRLAGALGHMGNWVRGTREAPS